MGKPRYKRYWYGNIERCLKNLRTIENEESLQANIFMGAYEKTVEKAQESEEGRIALRAVSMMYVDGTHTATGAAKALHVSRVTLQRYVSKFVYLLGENAGY